MIQSFILTWVKLKITIILNYINEFTPKIIGYNLRNEIFIIFNSPKELPNIILKMDKWNFL